jgi:hypothetical protein
MRFCFSSQVRALAASFNSLHTLSPPPHRHYHSLVTGIQYHLSLAAGLPGGVTYFLLVRVKLGSLPALVEKRITSLLNTWLRAPGLICVAAVQYVCAVSNLSLAPWPFTAVSILLAFANGV